MYVPHDSQLAGPSLNVVLTGKKATAPRIAPISAASAIHADLHIATAAQATMTRVALIGIHGRSAKSEARMRTTALATQVVAALTTTP
jgi:hypothetical protein